MVKHIIVLIYILFSGINSLSSQEYKDSMVISKKMMLHFDSDKSEIINSDYPLLENFIQFTKTKKEYVLQLRAHTDPVGSNEYNERLSKRRANFIVSYMTTNGIPSSKIRSSYHGEYKLLLPGDNEQNNKANRRCRVELYEKHKLIKLQGRVIDSKRQAIKDATIEVITSIGTSKARSNEKGIFKVFIPFKEPIKISAVAKGKFFKTINIKNPSMLTYSKLKIVMPDIIEGGKFILKSMKFIGNHANMLPSSISDLEQLRNTMTINENLCIEIAGHINRPNHEHVKRGSTDFELSVARSLAIYDSLRVNNIQPNRMLAKGYGNWYMLYPTTKKESEMQHNRRVEIIIKDCTEIQNIKNDNIKNRQLYDIRMNE